MTLSLIYARSRNFCIGRNGALPWELPDEFAHFTRTTLGGAVIMGRRSFEEHGCALEGRLNIVVSRNTALQLPPGLALTSSLAGAVELAARSGRPTWVIGGAGLYREALPLAQTVLETVIDGEFEGDTFIDDFDFSGWRTEVLQHHPRDPRHAHAFTVYRHSRGPG